MEKKKISKKQSLINKIMKEKDIKKGLSKLSMKELKEFDERGLKSHEWLDTIGSDEAAINRESVLTLMTRKKLLKIVSAIRMKNYSHLKHQDLINLIATKYWGDFHHRWVVEAQKDKSLFPDWYYGVNNEKLDNPRKIGRKKKVKKVKKLEKEPVKEDEPVEEKKEEKMTTKEATKKLKEILSSKVSTKTKTKQALNTLFTTMKGDVKFYKENKDNIDKLTSVEYRKKMGFEEKEPDNDDVSDKNLTKKEEEILDDIEKSKKKGRNKNPDILEYLKDIKKVGRKKATDKVAKGKDWSGRFDDYTGQENIGLCKKFKI
jgi:hypothetical protein